MSNIRTKDALVALTLLFISFSVFAQNIQYGVRPFYLIDAMKESPLKRKLKSCAGNTPRTAGCATDAYAYC